MLHIWILAAIVPLGMAVYWLLPYLYCRFVPRMCAARLNVHEGLSMDTAEDLTNRWLPKKLRSKILARLQKAGYFGPNALTLYVGLMVLLVPITLVIGFLTGQESSRFALLGIVLLTLSNTWISRRAAERKKAFTKALFKIYRFLDLQLTAGIRVTDTLRGLPDAVLDKTIHPVLVRFSAIYELTLNLETAFNEIRTAFRGTDCELLATHLRQCLLTGEAGRSMFRMEELLFSRYFNLMQNDSRKIRLHLLFVAMLGLLPGGILILYPFLSQAFSAMQSVFG